jgi:hypothetical protein
MRFQFATIETYKGIGNHQPPSAKIYKEVGGHQPIFTRIIEFEFSFAIMKSNIKCRA